MDANTSKTPQTGVWNAHPSNGILATPQQTDLEPVQWIMHRKRESLCRAISGNSEEHGKYKLVLEQRLTIYSAVCLFQCRLSVWEKEEIVQARDCGKGLFFFFNESFVLEKFQIHINIATRFQIPLYPTVFSPIINIWGQCSVFVTMNQYCYIIIY